MSKQLKVILELTTNLLIIILAIVGIKTIKNMNKNIPYIDTNKCYLVIQEGKEIKVCKVEEEE